MIQRLLTLGFILLSCVAFAQITVDIHPNFRHTVGGVDSFNRMHMVKIHGDQSETEWYNGNNFGNFGDPLDTLLKKYNATLGRNTGGVSVWINQIDEDPNRPGFVDTTHLATLGQNVRNNYANKPNLHQFEPYNELVVAAQHRPFYPDGTLTGKGWAIANGTAVGEYMGQYVNKFHGGNGQPSPTYVEIMNEPLWEFVTIGNEEPIDVFNFHNDVADEFKNHSNLPVGGYVAAFPNFEENNFQRWNDRMKLFMDVSGSRMDFWSIHLYDFNISWQNTEVLRRGSNMEATFDMMDHYSQLSFNEQKPYVISEYGGRALVMESSPWTPLRDWLNMKSFSSMLLSFTERPHLIDSAIPFIIGKALWGTQANGNPYPWRLMRLANEMPGQTGTHWVFTEQVKFFQLWSDVRGKRIDTRSTDPDIQSNAFTDDNKMYLIVNNLYFNDTTVHLNMVEHHGNAVQNIRVKHLHLNAAGDAPLLDENNYTTLDSITLGAEGTAVIEYTFASPVMLDELVDEYKIYANEHLTPIIPFLEHKFHINGVNKGTSGEAVLRLGMGRSHGASLQPTVKINGFEIQVPANYAGYDQSPRGSWFGVIEVPVPYYYIKADNEITVQFDDVSGHISSMALRVYNHTNSVFRSDSVHVINLALHPATKEMLPNTDFQLIPTVTPITATDHTLFWTSSDTSIATVDDFGKVIAKALGIATVTATSADGGLTATSTIEVVSSITPVAVTAINVYPDSFHIQSGNFVKLNAEITPLDATDQTVIWTSLNPAMASVDSTGMVQGILTGFVSIVGTTADGNLSDTSVIAVQSQFGTFMACSFLPDEVERLNNFDINMNYSSGYDAEIIITMFDENDIEIGQGQVAVTPGLGTATIPMNVPVLPDFGSDYRLEAVINVTAIDTVLFTCNQDNVEVVPPVSTVSVEFSEMKLYPNPTDGQLFIEVPNIEKEMLVTVLDINGRILKTERINQTTYLLDLRTMTSGMYLLQFSNDDGSVVKRVVVK